MALKDVISAAVMRMVPLFYNGLVRLLFGSCRISHQGPGYANFFKRTRDATPYVYAFWHYGVCYYPLLFKGIKAYAMVSASKDGEYIARILEHAGIKTVRGSSGTGGMRAMKELIATIKRHGDASAGIVADGSQGPARVAQAGAVLLASYSGYSILPLAWAAERYFVFHSWDRTILPKPFARVSMWYGEPFAVPAGIRSDDLEKYRLELETRLNGTYEKAWEKFEKKRH